MKTKKPPTKLVGKGRQYTWKIRAKDMNPKARIIEDAVGHFWCRGVEFETIEKAKRWRKAFCR